MKQYFLIITLFISSIGISQTQKIIKTIKVTNSNEELINVQEFNKKGQLIEGNDGYLYAKRTYTYKNDQVEKVLLDNDAVQFVLLYEYNSAKDTLFLKTTDGEVFEYFVYDDQGREILYQTEIAYSTEYSDSGKAVTYHDSFIGERYVDYYNKKGEMIKSESYNYSTLKHKSIYSYTYDEYGTWISSKRVNENGETLNDTKREIIYY